jgi:hypothetical protein
MKNDIEIDTDTIEEIREILINAIETRNWMEVEESLELLNEFLGYDTNEGFSGQSNENNSEE